MDPLHYRKYHVVGIDRIEIGPFLCVLLLFCIPFLAILTTLNPFLVSPKLQRVETKTILERKQNKNKKKIGTKFALSHEAKFIILC
jgi:hypothetical protein